MGLAFSPTWNGGYRPAGVLHAHRFRGQPDRQDELQRHRAVRLRHVFGGMRKSRYHNGGRIRFGPDGFLYIAIGDSQQSNLAQDSNALNGKILRITKTGAAAPGNPFGTAIYSYGHRNPQGLAWDSAGRLWSSELGNSSVDELNLIQPGKNYGWPTCEGTCSTTGMTNPKRTWSVSSASPSGLAYANGALFMAALRGQRMWRITLSGEDRRHSHLPLARNLRPPPSRHQDPRRKRPLVHHHQRRQQRRPARRLRQPTPLHPQHRQKLTAPSPPYSSPEPARCPHPNHIASELRPAEWCTSLDQGGHRLRTGHPGVLRLDPHRLDTSRLGTPVHEISDPWTNNRDERRSNGLGQRRQHEHHDSARTTDGPLQPAPRPLRFGLVTRPRGSHRVVFRRGDPPHQTPDGCCCHPPRAPTSSLSYPTEPRRVIIPSPERAHHPSSYRE